MLQTFELVKNLTQNHPAMKHLHPLDTPPAVIEPSKELINYMTNHMKRAKQMVKSMEDGGTPPTNITLP